MSKTPVTGTGLKKHDKLSPCKAAVAAWRDQGPNIAWHLACKEEVRELMPLLARALDRMVAEDDRTEEGRTKKSR